MGTALRMQIELPEDIATALEAVGYTSRQLGEDAMRHLAVVLYGRSVLALEQAARMAGVPLWEFIPLLGENGVALADYDEAQVSIEMENARWMTSVVAR